MNAPPQGQPQVPPGSACPNCGYPSIGNLDRCPNCGYRLRKKFGGCRVIAAIVVLVIFTILGAGFLLLAACAAGLGNNSGSTASQREMNEWALGIGAIEVLLITWLVYEIVRVSKRR